MIPTASNIKMLTLDELRPYDRNARLHTASRVEKIAKSMATYGFNNPILIDFRPGHHCGPRPA